MGNKQMPGMLQESTIFHQAAQEEFQSYFPEVSDKKLNLVRNPSRCSVGSITNKHWDELINQQNDFTAKNF